MSGTTTIRSASLADAGVILDCLRLAFAPYEQQYTTVAFEDTVLTRESVPRRLEEMTVFVAVDDSGRVVGTIACSLVSHVEGHLRGMAVRPEWQASGLADQLLKRAEAELANRNCLLITLDTTEPLQLKKNCAGSANLSVARVNPAMLRRRDETSRSLVLHWGFARVSNPYADCLNIVFHAKASRVERPVSCRSSDVRRRTNSPVAPLHWSCLRRGCDGERAGPGRPGRTHNFH